MASSSSTSPAPSDVLKRPPRQGRLFINGQWREASDAGAMVRHSPAHDVVVSHNAMGTAQDAHEAVQAARTAFEAGHWAALPGAERARLLREVAEGILRQLDELALMETLETGKPLAQAREEVKGSADLWHYAATLARHLHGESMNHLGAATLGITLREPIGVVALVTPWNFPLLIVSQKLPFALAAGNTVVVKPSEFTPSTTLMLGEIMQQAGFPAGVVNLLPGLGETVGEALAQSPQVDMISFTGSTVVGKHVMAVASGTLKKVVMELGGKNPQIIFPDADLDAAVEAVANGMAFNAGQCCNSGSRVLVHQDIAATFTQRVAARVREVRVGDPLDAATQVGAITTEKQFQSIQQRLAQAKQSGARVVLEGRVRPSPGMFIEPSVLDQVKPDMPLAREEIFGPVLAVLPFASAAQARQIANDTHYGLSAAVWSRDINTCLGVARGLKAGTVWINTFLEGHAELPFGGYGQSGLGRELGQDAALDYTQLKTLHLRLRQP